MSQRRLIFMAGLCLSVAAAAYAANSPLEGANLTTHMAGPEVTVDDFKGKVVLFEYWGYY